MGEPGISDAIFRIVPIVAMFVAGFGFGYGFGSKASEKEYDAAFDSLENATTKLESDRD